MKLTQVQFGQFDRDGYLCFPSLFTREETEILRQEVPRIYVQDRPQNIREKDRTGVRTNFAAPLYSEPFAKRGRHPRMIGPAKQLLDDELNMHQLKINGKRGFDGDVWRWHQDYGTWLNDDMMPTPRAMNAAIFPDDVNEFNSPLMFIPGSHKLGALDAGHDTSTASYPLRTIDNDNIRSLVDQAGIVPPKGPAGSMIMFHSCLVRRVEPYPAFQAPGLYRASRFHAARLLAGRLPDARPSGRPAMGERHAAA